MMTQSWVSVGSDNGFVAWQHQAITWINVDLSLIRSSDIHLRAISQEILRHQLIKLTWKNPFKPPKANELDENYLYLQSQTVAD